MNRAPLGPQTCKWAADGNYVCDHSAAGPEMTQTHVYGREKFETARRLYGGEPPRPPPRVAYGKARPL